MLRGVLVANIVFLLYLYLEPFPVAYAGIKPRYKPALDSGHDLLPDIALWSIEEGISDELFVIGVPLQAIEIQSPYQTDDFLHKKAKIYLAYGTRIVWLVFPDTHTIEVLTVNSSQTLSENDMLDGGAVLPNFQLLVSKIFAWL